MTIYFLPEYAGTVYLHGTAGGMEPLSLGLYPSCPLAVWR